MLPYSMVIGKNSIYLSLIGVILVVLILITHDPSLTVVRQSQLTIDEIKLRLDKVNYCSVQDDCVVKNYGCPFGCYTFINQNEDVTGLEADIENFLSAGNRCVYDCDRNPLPEEIGCINRTCVDLRFEDK